MGTIEQVNTQACTLALTAWYRDLARVRRARFGGKVMRTNSGLYTRNHTHALTCLLASSVRRATKMVIWRRKSMRTAKAAYIEKIFTAGMSVMAPKKKATASEQPVDVVFL